MNERLTEQRQDMCGYYAPIHGVEGMACVQELGAIEDIMYAPDGTPRITLDDLRTLVDAWADGRAVALPRKPGDPVWHVVYEPDYIDFGTPPQYGIRKEEFHFYDFPNVGKTIFLTLNEAVASRKKLMRSESAEAAKGGQK